MICDVSKVKVTLRLTVDQPVPVLIDSLVWLITRFYLKSEVYLCKGFFAYRTVNASQLDLKIGH